jgi:hypothetical protein
MWTQYFLICNLKKISILHECKESRFVDRLLRVKSTQLQFDKENIEEESTMNPFYEDDIENKLQQNIHYIKEQNINIQIKFSLEQILIEYLLCNTIIKTYATEITKHIEIMKRKTQNENINNHNVNFIIKP